MQRRWPDRLALCSLGAALLAALLVFDPAGPDFAAPKAAFLLLIAAIALPWLPNPGPGVLALLAALLLSPLLALDPAHALWGQPPRAEGAVLLAAVIVLAVWSRRLSPAAVERLDRMLHLAGALLALSVLAGGLQLPWTGLPPGVGDGHGGTLGNPNTAGSVLAALLVHAAARGGGGRWLLPLYAAALLGTGSQAAWLAMLLGLAWLLPTDRLRYWTLGALSLAGLASVAALSFKPEPAPSAALRVEIWGAALRALAPTSATEDPLGHWRWLVGYGPEQQAEVLERHRRPEQNAWEAGGHERVADRAHSLPLDLWLSFGIAGLAAGLGVAWRIQRAHANARAEAAAALTLLAAALLGFLGPAEWLLLALWLIRLRPLPTDTASDLAHPSIRALISLLLAGAVVALLALGTPAVRDNDLRRALEADYRALAAAVALPSAYRELAARGCARAEQRPRDGEAALLCAQMALAAADLPRARVAATRATTLRPARPRAWLLRVLADPARPQPALAGLRATLLHSDLDEETAAAARAALRAAAAQHPTLAADADYREIRRLLKGGEAAPDAAPP